MAQVKNTSAIVSNRLFTGIYDLKFNFKDKNFLEVREGDVIYSKGDRSEYIYLVLNGRIKFKTYENPRQPKVFLVSSKEFFGEREIIDKTARISSALAERDSLLYKINHKDFFKLISQYRKIMENLSGKKYEEVVPPSRKAEFKEDVFKRILNEPESRDKRISGIELKDYSYENPLLEMKAKDEITEELKIYQEEDETDNLQLDDLSVDDIDVRWELNEDLETEFSEEQKPENTPDEGVITDEEKTEEDNPVLSVAADESAENIIENFRKIQDEVNNFSQSITDTEQEIEEDITPLPVEPFRFTESVPESFVSAVVKLSSGISSENVYKIIVETCAELVNAEMGILYFPDENNVLKGKLPDDDTEIIAGADSVPGRSLRELDLINIRDVFNDPNFNPTYDYISYFHIHSLICVPIIVEDTKVKAVLQLFNSRNGEFSESDENMLKSISPVLLKTLERTELYEETPKESEPAIAEIERIEEKPPEPEKETGKTVLLKVVSDFLLQEFQVIVGDIKQFNSYIQRIDVQSEVKEISDIVTSQTSKIIDVLELLKIYSDKNKIVTSEKDSYIAILDDMVNLLAEYTESRKVNLYKRFDEDAVITADPKFLYLAIFQIIKYQCDRMPLGGNIFISSVINDDSVEINIRNATRKTDESLMLNSEFEYNEKTPSGLGLSLSRRIIEDHNAELSIKNQSGTGLEIAIRFPLLK